MQSLLSSRSKIVPIPCGWRDLIIEHGVARQVSEQHGEARRTQSASHVTDYVSTCLLTVTAQTRYREDGGSMSFRNSDLHQRHQHHRRENLRAHTAHIAGINPLYVSVAGENRNKLAEIICDTLQLYV